MDIIIGAGATGLTYASQTKNPYLILEADEQIGGYCKTIKKDGFVWDYSGHFFHFRNKELEKYICHYIDSSTLLRCNKNTQIYYHKSHIDFPFQKNIHQLPKKEFIDCLYDLFNNPYKTFSNFKEMLYSKFGTSISDKFLIPYNEKLYSCNLNKLDSEAMGRFFPYANKEEIIANFKSSKNTSYNDTFTYPRGGAIEYITSISKRINNENISLNESVLAIDTKQQIVHTNRRQLHYDRLISTIPFNKLLKLCNISYDQDIYTWNKVLVFNLGFDKNGKDKKNNWIYFPEKKYCFYRVGYYNNIFNDNRMSLYVELGFDKNADIDVDKNFDLTIQHLKSCGIITDQQLISYHYVIMNPGYVHINKKSIEDVATRKKELSRLNIYSIGRYGSWTYCSIEDGMNEAFELAQLLL